MKISDVTIPNTKCNKYNIPMPKTPITLTTKPKHKVHQPNHQVPQAKQTGSFCASVCGNVLIENLDFSNYVFQCFSCTLVKVKTATLLGAGADEWT